jgi:PKD repeat protein
MSMRVRNIVCLIAAIAIAVLALPLAGSCSETATPVARFTGQPTIGGAPLEVQFNDQSTGEMTSWKWNFGDGAVGTQRNPTHTYTNSGSFTVFLEVAGPGGSSRTSKTHYIIVLSTQEMANKERTAAADAITKCLLEVGVIQLDEAVEGWDGSPGVITAGDGNADASDYLIDGVAPFRAKYDVNESGAITYGVDVSWGGLTWDDTHDRWLQ